LGDTGMSGRRVTSKAPLAHVEGGSGHSDASPTAILKDTHSVEGEFSEVHPQMMPIGRSTVPADAPRIMHPSQGGTTAHSTNRTVTSWQ
jgi:hypothetical protein